MDSGNLKPESHVDFIGALS